MTQLLVSVQSAEEAAIAVAEGADWIDVKQPSAGSLGAAPPETVAEILSVVAERRPVSVALGELLDGPARISEMFALPKITSGVKLAKIGLAGAAAESDWPNQWRSAFSLLPASIGAVAVCYADWRRAESPAPDDILAQAIDAGCVALLVDTFDKRGPGLTALWTKTELARFTNRAQERGLLVALAGKITAADLPLLADVNPNLVAVRGAVCSGDRTGSLDPKKLRQFRRLVDDPFPQKEPCHAAHSTTSP